MFVFLIIVDILFLVNYFALMQATDNGYTNEFRDSSIADAVKCLNKLSGKFNKLWQEYEFYNDEKNLRKVMYFCMIRIVRCLLILVLLIYLKVSLKIDF